MSSAATPCRSAERRHRWWTPDARMVEISPGCCPLQRGVRRHPVGRPGLLPELPQVVIEVPVAEVAPVGAPHWTEACVVGPRGRSVGVTEAMNKLDEFSKIAGPIAGL